MIRYLNQKPLILSTKKPGISTRDLVQLRVKVIEEDEEFKKEVKEVFDVVLGLMGEME